MSNPKIAYLRYGGKSSLSKWIVSHFPEHRVYLEPFAGSCAVLFAKPKSFVEIVNDLDGRLIRMFETLRSRPEELAAMLWATPYSKANWRDVPVADEALEDARLLIAEGKQFYVGNENSSTWSLDKSPAPHKPKASVWADWFLRILPAADRLREVTILNEDATDAIERVYQQPEALIFCDPPYVGHEDEYRHKLDYERFAKKLHEAKARVIVSEYPAAGDYFQTWHRIEKVTAKRSGSDHSEAGRKKTEVLYLNFEPSLAEAA